MTRPLVAVAGLRARSITGLRRPGIGVSERVLDSVFRAGAEPVVLPPIAALDHYALGPYVGVVLPGGGDLDPSWYGQQRDDASEDVDLIHDRCDLTLVRDCIARRMPLLAICRGMQALNVACGGTIRQDIGPSDVPHRNGMHTVTLTPGSAVARAMGCDEVVVSSYHHQSLDALGDGLAVTGRAPDGCVETVEHREAPVLAVQWHPEDDAHEQPYEQALFDALLTPQSWYETAGAVT
ncbi:gamma-glutamyl-gamma-aminobutyrate hydrolase family protein [Solicola gregarius]|uniref:Gamma-glutamyl-gamma-aminobutyrate hydrolase family protein n=1 Tax=Solicola gregarius TaxID=2908642 RepID=A0AA46TGW1_9ACTN|nr:gamma-glutamyl-gamma-aminobutyrate hydrolase family protein [Solicola gregarius]UYM04911.1 gamma-glutamyl-gamma-aminobutyrate hydrolase family protein [Solicola gregarius]